MPAHYGFLPSPGHPRRFLCDGPVFHVLRETSDRTNAGSSEGTTRSRKGLVEGGNQVTLFLAQNGVLSARPSAQSATLSALARSGVTVLADDFSLQERGIGKLAQGVAAAPIDVVVDHLAAGHKTLWH